MGCRTDLNLDWAYQKYDDEPYIQGAGPYMDKAIAWARQTGLKVWIDLHGAPGSQNGFDNSGHLTKSPSWTQGDTTRQTLEVIKQIAEKYAKKDYQDVVVAMELLNEPLPDKLSGIDAVVQFSKSGYGEVRDVSDTPVVVHDAFQTGTFWNDKLVSSDTQNGIPLNLVQPPRLTEFSCDRSSRVSGLQSPEYCSSLDLCSCRYSQTPK